MSRTYVNIWYKNYTENFQTHVNDSKRAAYHDAYSAFKINPEVTSVELRVYIEDEYAQYSQVYDVITRAEYKKMLILLTE